MTMTNQVVKEKLAAAFSDKMSCFSEPYGMLECVINAEDNIDIIKRLYDEFGFQYMTDVTAVQFPDREGQEYMMVYHMHNLYENSRLRMKAYLSKDNLNIFSATAIFESANWQEREIYDNFGIIFLHHPNLKRILNSDEMDYFPMRKEYPLEDRTRLDKDDAMFGR